MRIFNGIYFLYFSKIVSHDQISPEELILVICVLRIKFLPVISQMEPLALRALILLLLTWVSLFLMLSIRYSRTPFSFFNLDADHHRAFRGEIRKRQALRYLDSIPISAPEADPKLPEPFPESPINGTRLEGIDLCVGVQNIWRTIGDQYVHYTVGALAEGLSRLDDSLLMKVHLVLSLGDLDSAMELTFVQRWNLDHVVDKIIIYPNNATLPSLTWKRKEGERSARISDGQHKKQRDPCKKQ